MKITREQLELMDQDSLINIVLTQEQLIDAQSDMISHYKFSTIITQQAIAEAIELINDRT